VAWGFKPLPLAANQVNAVALGSNSILPQQGAFTRSHTVALLGSQAAFAQGTENPDRSIAVKSFDDPVDTKILSGIGTLTYVLLSGGDIDVFLSGSESTTGQGSVTTTRSKVLTGSEAASGHGTLAPGITPTTLVSQLIQPAAGTLVYTLPGSGDVTVNLNAGEETEITSFIGTLRTASPLAGTAVTTAQGAFTLSNVPTASLTGLEATSALNSVTVQQDVEDTYIASGIGSVVFTMVTALSGVEMATEQGTVGVTGDVTAALTGVEFTTEQEDVIDGFELPLVGNEMLGEQTDDNFGLPLNIELSGAESLVETGTVYLDNDRAYPLIGIASLVEQGTMPSFVNAFVNGEFISTEQETIGPKTVALTGEEIDMRQGRIHHRGKSDDAGKPDKGKDKKPKKVKVEIDGEIFEVNSIEEGEALFRHTLEIAAETAKAAADAQVAAALANKDKEAKVKLTVPRIKGNKELAEEVAAIYTQATIDAQVALETARLRQVDEEDALVLLLLN